MNPLRLIHNILAIAAVLGALASAILGALFGSRAGLSCALGAIVGAANLWALARIVVALLDPAMARARRIRAAIYLGAKFIVLLVVVGVLVTQHVVRGAPFMVGISTVALSIVIGGLLRDEPTDGPSLVSRKGP